MSSVHHRPTHRTLQRGDQVRILSPARFNRWTRAGALIAVLAFLLTGVGVGGWLYLRSIDRSVKRVDTFEQIPPDQRPVRAADSALNFLVVGTDEADPGGARPRTDTIILVHVPHSRDRAQLVSIPRDTWVTVPASPGGDQPRPAKINAAYAWGGTPLLVRTVESVTGVRIDHVVIVDFAGFGRVIDALGGVDVPVDAPFTSFNANGAVFQPGTHRMTSAVALEYARERHQFADGDFSRVRHQQAILAAVLQEATRKGVLTDPARLNSFLRAIAGAVQVDENLSITDTVWGLRQIGADSLVMLTSPSAGTGMVGDQSVVLPDRAAAARLYQAISTDTMDRWLEENPR
ncbi:LCP family protein [Micromonospora sp. ATA51]|uniref:LCP family protein n=1 Tax=Micromonospora sicca TaxID=2202420 RepID=A0ABU5JND5_9ACTN|nr:LCP family protein [Micromonospora sp. 4G53]MBM0225049.1 LCP family protein [Micromonospora sp. ATA51]MDZ5494154.1 LCP family protein [Micromonospora sp. 4G53]